MDLTEQNKFSEELKEFLARKLKDKQYHNIITIETAPDAGFAFTTSTLTEESKYQTLKIAMDGIGQETESLMNKFELPAEKKLNKPVEPKW